MKPIMIIGGPGTGKTYQLVQSIVERKPKNFALVSFTRRAANEARQRLQSFYSDDELRYVRTIHSFCFELLKLRSTQVLKYSDLRQFGNQYGYEFTFRNSGQEDGSYYGLNEDDMEYRNLLIQKAKMKEPDVYESGMYQSYLKFKLENKLFDFNDMIETVINSAIVLPKFDLVCVDEIQDLTPLQMQFIYLLVHSAKDVIFAGDGDQMIFEWAGVDRQEYLKLVEQCNLELLTKNHRLPQGIIQKANQIILNYNRNPYIDNSLQYIPDLPEFNPGETYLVLSRNNYILKEIMGQYDELGISWEWLQQNHRYPERTKFNILASTIHGAKGAEADNVVLIPDVSPATYADIDSETERRVWYVGLTRPRKRLYILSPQTEFYYDLL